MDEDAVRRRWSEYMSERANRPFGDVEAVSGRALQPFSFAGQRAAENLLVKARRALDEGDARRARALVDRAARLPFDHHERAAPVALAVHMDLFCLVTDALERAEPDDSRWLDAATGVLEGADPAAACDLRDVLVAIDQDYSLRGPEHRQIQAAIASVPHRAEFRDLELDAAELGEHVLSILGACGNYQRALQALAG